MRSPYPCSPPWCSCCLPASTRGIVPIFNDVSSSLKMSSQTMICPTDQTGAIHFSSRCHRSLSPCTATDSCELCGLRRLSRPDSTGVWQRPDLKESGLCSVEIIADSRRGSSSGPRRLHVSGRLEHRGANLLAAGGVRCGAPPILCAGMHTLLVFPALCAHPDVDSSQPGH